MGIVARSWIRHRAGAPREQVTHVVRQQLNVVGRHFGVIPKDMVVSRSTCTLQTKENKMKEMIRDQKKSISSST